MDGSWQWVAMSLIAGVFAYLNKRNDSQIKELQTQNGQQAKQIEANTVALSLCNSDHKDTKALLEACKDRDAKTRTEVAVILERLEHKDREIRSISEQLLLKRDKGTGEHRPLTE